MYNAKEEGRNRTSFFHKEMDTLMREQVSLEADLKECPERGRTGDFSSADR